MDTTLKKKKVLVVEDDRDLIKVIEIGLNVLGYESIVSMDGKQAVRMAAEEKPDLITMDINMPDIDGFEAVRLIRQNPETRSIPVLALTANAFFKDRTECLQSGFDDYLAKPFSRKQLAEHIKTLLG